MGRKGTRRSHALRREAKNFRTAARCSFWMDGTVIPFGWGDNGRLEAHYKCYKHTANRVARAGVALAGFEVTLRTLAVPLIDAPSSAHGWLLFSHVAPVVTSTPRGDSRTDTLALLQAIADIRRAKSDRPAERRRSR